jgi:hypothetical protein
MPNKTKKSGTKTSKGLQIGLWIMFILAIIGLIVSIVIQCKDDSKDNFELGETSNERCGNCGSCQNANKFSPDVRSSYKMDEYYPVDTTASTICNQVSESWLKNTTKEDKENLTVSKDGKLYICNRSCPPDVIACGLSDKGLATGVM